MADECKITRCVWEFKSADAVDYDYIYMQYYTNRICYCTVDDVKCGVVEIEIDIEASVFIEDFKKSAVQIRRVDSYNIAAYNLKSNIGFYERDKNSQLEKDKYINYIINTCYNYGIDVPYIADLDNKYEIMKADDKMCRAICMLN